VVQPFGICRLCCVLLEAGDVSVVFHVAVGQIPPLNWLGAIRLVLAVNRTIRTSFCAGLQAELMAGESVKVVPVSPVFAVDAVMVPEP
jgi:hypothetical protein